MIEKARVLLTISGRVQGVGYRYFTRTRAQQLDLMGYVKNLRDGGVEAEVEGDKESIKILINMLREGPSLSHVENIHIDWRDYKDQYHDFSVRFW